MTPFEIVVLVVLGLILMTLGGIAGSLRVLVLRTPDPKAEQDEDLGAFKANAP